MLLSFWRAGQTCHLNVMCCLCLCMVRLVQATGGRKQASSSIRIWPAMLALSADCMLYTMSGPLLP